MQYCFNQKLYWRLFHILTLKYVLQNDLLHIHVKRFLALCTFFYVIVTSRIKIVTGAISCKLVFTLQWGLTNLIPYCYVALIGDRCVAVLKPILYREKFKRAFGRKLAFLLLIFALVISLPAIYNRDYVNRRCEVMFNVPFFDMYIFLLFDVSATYIPCSLIAICSFVIIWKTTCGKTTAREGSMSAHELRLVVIVVSMAVLCASTIIYS